MSALWTSLAVLALAARCPAEVKGVLVDPLTSGADWQVGGRRVNYVLGESSLTASKEQTLGGAAAALKLTYDFADPQRDYVSAYHTGEAIPGQCEEIAFQLYGDGSQCRLRLSVEDARERWFERDVGTVDWRGWKEVRTAIGDGQGWQPLLRRGEERLPILQPVNLRQIALFRSPTVSPKGAVYLQDLRAKTDLVPADSVSAKLTTGRPANLFALGETPTVQVELSDRGEQSVSGELRATVRGFFASEEVAIGPITVPAKGTVKAELKYPTPRTGSYEAALKLKAGGRERLWFTRFAVMRPRPQPTPDPKALFGCCATLSGFTQSQLSTVLRLNRDGGVRWERLGFGWGEINPAPGVWTWEGPPRVAGPAGKGIALAGRSLQLPHSPRLDCPDAVTIALWARGTGSNGMWQALIQKWGSGNRRNYGVYFSLQDGSFCFSASYANFPTADWSDVSSGFSGWDNQWHHYAATYSRAAKKVTLYVDGQVKAAPDWDGGELRTNDGDLVLGGGYPGDLDEVVLYRRALSATEIVALAQKSAPPQAGLIGHWTFDEPGPTLKDSSPNHLDFASAEVEGARIARLGLGNGIKTLGLLGFPPNWASTAPKGAARPWCYKPDLKAWAEFVENTTRHYRDLVQHWEIWNEPNIDVFWLPKPDAKEYFDVLRVGYAAAKRGNPDCEVLMPGLAGPIQRGWGMDFLDELLELGAAKYCDAISIHPYRQASPEESDLVGDLRHIADLAAKHGGQRPIWFTEDCWTTDLPGGSSEERAAEMIPRCYALALGTGLMERFIFFRLHDPGVDRFYGEDNYGMCWNDLTPKPALLAHATTARMLEGGKPEGEWDVGPRALARVFRTPAGRVAAVWSPEGKAPVSIYLGQPKAQLVDIMGNETTASTQDGVLLLEASEAVTFLAGLPPQAEGRGTVLAAEAAPVVRGAKGTLAVRVRNPFARALQAAVSAKGDAALALPTPAPREMAVPANGSANVPLEIAVPADAEPGWHAAEVTLRLAGATYTQRVPVGVRSAATDAGPVGEWKLDEGQGTVVHDSSGHGNDGSVDQPQWVDGKHGKALQFDAQHIAVVPDSPSLNLRDEVTVAFWLKLLGDTGTWQFPVAKYWQENIRRNYGIYIHKDTLSPYFSASFEKGSYLHSDLGVTTSINDGQWHHLAASYSMFDRRFRLYLDGQVKLDRPDDEGALLLTTDPLRIGVGTRGIIDEVRLYPRAVRPEEIGAMMVAG